MKWMGLEAAEARRGHAYTCNVAKNSKRPANVSVTPDLPARGAVPRMGEPERPKDLTDASDTRVDHCEQFEYI